MFLYMQCCVLVGQFSAHERRVNGAYQYIGGVVGAVHYVNNYQRIHSFSACPNRSTHILPMPRNLILQILLRVLLRASHRPSMRTLACRRPFGARIVPRRRVPPDGRTADDGHLADGVVVLPDETTP